jgi:hypothetical protein
VTSSQKSFVERRQYDGWYLNLPEVIEYIKMEANALDLDLNNGKFINLPHANAPQSFLAKGRARSGNLEIVSGMGKYTLSET